MIKSVWKFIKWLICVIVLVAIVATIFTSCNKTNGKDNDAVKNEAVSYTFDVNSLTGKTIAEAREAFAESENYGYQYTFLLDGVDMGFDAPSDFDDQYIVESVSGNGKKFNLNIKDIEEIANETEQERLQSVLSEKLDDIDALTAVEDYGKAQFGESFKIGILDEYEAIAKDENTWTIKSRCKIDGVEHWVFADVTGTSLNPQVTYFEVHK